MAKKDQGTNNSDNKEQEVKIYADRHIKRDEAGTFLAGVVHFHSEYEEGTIPDGTINLSRNKTNPDCEFTLANLQDHNSHSPGWNNEADMELYVQRVMKDADKLLQIGEV